MPPELKNLKLPVLLSKAEALDWAARQMAVSADAVLLTKMIVDTAEGGPMTDDLKAVLATAKRALIDPELQAASMRAAAAAMRELALEERLVAARAAAKGARV